MSREVFFTPAEFIERFNIHTITIHHSSVRETWQCTRLVLVTVDGDEDKEPIEVKNQVIISHVTNQRDKSLL
jgi:hypothetical protein